MTSANSFRIVMSMIKRERLKGRQKAFTRSVSLTDNDLDIARALGNGNASQGIKTALRLAIKLDQATYELL
jgi:hypothetical protein